MYIVVLVTCTNKKEAKRIAEKLVQDKLAACVSIIPQVESIFCWQGKLENALELLLVAKSKKSHLARIIKIVRKFHSYEVPEIIALPMAGGYKNYLEWIDASVR